MIKKSKLGRSLCNEQGFSLIEVLMTVILLTLGILAVARMTATIMDKNIDSRKTSLAMTLAQDKIEYLKGTARAWLLSGADGLDSPDLVSGVWTEDIGGETIDSEGNAAASGSTYTRTWTISEVGGENFLYFISIVMTWQDSGTQTLQLDTQVTQ